MTNEAEIRLEEQSQLYVVVRTNTAEIRLEEPSEISVVERTDKAEISPEEQSEKAESCREKICNEIQLKGP